MVFLVCQHRLQRAEFRTLGRMGGIRLSGLRGACAGAALIEWLWLAAWRAAFGSPQPQHVRPLWGKGGRSRGGELPASGMASVPSGSSGV